MNTWLIIPPVVVNGLGDVLFENSEGLLGDFFLPEIIGHNVFNQLGDIFVPFSEIFNEFIDNHLPKLLSLLDSLRFLDGRMQFATFSGTLRFRVLLDLAHLSYIKCITTFFHNQVISSTFNT